jgi:hypothetical protein
MFHLFERRGEMGALARRPGARLLSDPFCRSEPRPICKLGPVPPLDALSVISPSWRMHGRLQGNWPAPSFLTDRKQGGAIP